MYFDGSLFNKIIFTGKVCYTANVPPVESCTRKGRHSKEVGRWLFHSRKLLNFNVRINNALLLFLNQTILQCYILPVVVGLFILNEDPNEIQIFHTSV